MPLKDSDVLFEDNHLIAIHKPVGALSQGDKTGDISIIDEVKQYIKTKYNKPGKVYLAGLHRLDRPVQGILLFAKTSKAAERMSKAFKEGKVNKSYWAIIEGKPAQKSGSIISFLAKNSKTNIVTSSHKNGNGKEGRTLYSVLKNDGDKHLILLKPITGKSHQLRVHCAQELNCPIIGDVKYGSKQKTNNRSLFLLAREVEFIHPVTKEKTLIKSLLPSDELWQKMMP